MKDYEKLHLPIGYNHPVVDCGERRYTFEITQHDDYGEISYKISLFAQSTSSALEALYNELSDAEIPLSDVTITRH